MSALAVIPASSTAVRPAAVIAAAPRPLPPYVAPITAVDHDGDGDNDLGTIVDTFA